MKPFLPIALSVLWFLNILVSVFFLVSAEYFSEGVTPTSFRGVLFLGSIFLFPALVIVFNLLCVKYFSSKVVLALGIIIVFLLSRNLPSALILLLQNIFSPPLERAYSIISLSFYLSMTLYILQIGFILFYFYKRYKLWRSRV